MSILVDIHKAWPDFSLDIRFEAGDEVVGLLGGSGAGKSMTLRSIAGIAKPDSGKILLNGRALFDSARGINLPPRKRRVGLMFQSYALFPDMTVSQNIGAGVSDRSVRAERVRRYVRLLRLEGLEGRYPRQLSGGQQQRAALARMMAGEPEILMLDEPFSAIDAQLRQEIEPEFTAALTAYRGTVLYVSHDISEAYRYCSQTVLVREGRVLECGGTKELFARPGTSAGARLLCCKNICAAEPDGGRLLARGWGLSLPGGAFGAVGIFSDDIELSLLGGPDWHPAMVVETGARPRYTVLRLLPENGEQPLSASCGIEEAARLLAGAENGRLFFRLPPEKILYLDAPRT